MSRIFFFSLFLFEMLLSSARLASGKNRSEQPSRIFDFAKSLVIIVFHRSRSFISAYIVTIRLALSKDSLGEEKDNNLKDKDNRGEKNNRRKKNGDEGCVTLRHADAKKIMWNNPLKDRRRVLPELIGSKRSSDRFRLIVALINFTNACNTLSLTLFFFLFFSSSLSRKSWGNDVQCIRRFFSRVIFEEGSIFRSS